MAVVLPHRPHRRALLLFALLALPLLASAADLDRLKALIAALTQTRAELERVRLDASRQASELAQREEQLQKRAQIAAARRAQLEAQREDLQKRIAQSRAAIQSATESIDAAALERAITTDSPAAQPNETAASSLIASLTRSLEILRQSHEIRLEHRDLKPFGDDRLCHARVLRIGSLMTAWLSEDGLAGGLAKGRAGDAGPWKSLDEAARAQLSALIEVLSAARPAELLPLPLPEDLPRRKAQGQP